MYSHPHQGAVQKICELRLRTCVFTTASQPLPMMAGSRSYLLVGLLVVACVRPVRTLTSAAVRGMSLRHRPAVLSTGGAQVSSGARLVAPQCSEKQIVRGVGAGRDLPAPSGINAMPLGMQAAIVFGIIAAIGVGTALIAGPTFDAVRGSFLWNLSRPSWPALGLIYLAAGIAHFTELEGFENITPPNGTWGWFYTPFSPKVNVIWTGVVEIFGGSWMLFGALAPLAGFTLPATLGPVVSDAALTLFLLTVMVTPANIYALTHGSAFLHRTVCGHLESVTASS